MEEKINELNLKKQEILNHANSEQRDITSEEKELIRKIDEELYNISNGLLNPTDMINTSARTNIAPTINNVENTQNVNIIQPNNTTEQTVVIDNVVKQPVNDLPVKTDPSIIDTVQSSVSSGIEEVSYEEQKQEYEKNKPVVEIQQPVIKENVNDDIQPVIKKKSNKNIIIIAVLIIVVIILLIFLAYKYFLA